MDLELERFKTDIDLRGYAAEHGFSLDAKESWSGSAVMRNQGTGEKIIIKRAQDSHYIYFSVHDESDNGTIVDFAQRRLRMSLGAIRKELRPWINESPDAPALYTPLPKTSRDRIRVETEYSRSEAVTRHAYLENHRAIPPRTIGSDRFVNRNRKDHRGNAVFPHFDGDGLCGFELKNVDFTGFSSGGVKGLWLSQSKAEDTRLVLAESSIDAISHATLFPDAEARYASIGGQVNPRQPLLIAAAASRMPVGSEIIAAMDADDDGRKLAAMIRRSVESLKRGDLRFVLVEPFGFKDWNEELKAKSGSTRISSPQDGPALS
jgi:hypothetical protein